MFMQVDDEPTLRWGLGRGLVFGVETATSILLLVCKEEKAGTTFPIPMPLEGT